MKGEITLKDLVLSSKLENINPYKADETKYKVRLNANEGFDIMGKYLLDQVKKEIYSIDFNRYPSSSCIELRRLYSIYSGASYEEIMVGNGSDELIQIITNSLLSKGDTVLTLDPDFGMYNFYGNIIEAQVIKYELEKQKLSFDVDHLINFAKKNKVKLFIFSNPNNPTSKVIGEEEIIKIIENLKNTVIVVDEAYYEFYGKTLVNYINKYENLIILRTLSKAFGLASLRIGFLISNKELIENIKKVKAPFNVNSISQKIGEVALKNTELMKESVNLLISLKESFGKELKEMEKKFGGELFKVYPSYANFFYIKAVSAKEIASKLKENSISVSEFYGEFLRVTVGSEEENRAFTETLKLILNNLYNGSITADSHRIKFLVDKN